MALPAPKVLLLMAVAAAGLVAGQAVLVGRPQRAATLGRLVALNSCLVANNQQRARTAAATLRAIRYQVAENINQPADLATLRAAQRIQTRTLALTDTLYQLRQHWPPADPQAALLRLEAQLQHYSDALREFVPNAALLDQPSEALFHEDWLNQASLPTASQPIVAAAFTRLEAKVRYLNAEALQSQAEKVSSKYDGFDIISAYAVPTSEVVAPGAEYEAQLLLAAPSSRGHLLTIAANLNGKAVATKPFDRKYSVAFRVPAARPGQPDTVRARWQGQVRCWYEMADTALTVTVPYLIVKPIHP